MSYKTSDDGQPSFDIRAFVDFFGRPGRPFVNKKFESNLEVFLFVMGIVAATLADAWSTELIHEGLVAPLSITLAVLGTGVLFYYLRDRIDRGVRRVLITVPCRPSFAAAFSYSDCCRASYPPSSPPFF